MSGIDWDKLPEVLAEHTADWCSWGDGPRGPEDSDYYTCLCRGPRWHVNTSADYYQAHAEHLAAVCRAWVEGQMTEEWGLDWGDGERWPEPDKTTALELLAADNASHALVRRLVTPWAALEGDKP